MAFLLPKADTGRAIEILEVENRFAVAGRRLVGLSVSAGILTYKAGLDPQAHVAEIAALVDSLNRDGFSVVLIPHVQEQAVSNNDLYACVRVLRETKQPQENVVVSTPCTASEYKAIIGLCEVLVGARTHATVGSMSQGIPTVAIAYSRKAYGI